ncbi:MAG TPA: hypothetical protein VFX89_02720 [Gammaproteobacteria bacterium]|nr:hypothetical protein [Gammaproteobacteria bacterium]
MRRLMVAAALIASGAVFAADLAKDHLQHVRAVYPNFGVAVTAEHVDELPKPAPAMRFRLAHGLDSDITYDGRWRVREAFGYHRSAFDSAEPDQASAGDSEVRDDSPPRESRGAPRVQF